MEDIQNMLTLERIRGMYQSENVFSKLPIGDLENLRDWLDLLSDEVYTMKRTVMRELKCRHRDRI